ncbi:uncharacterized protein JCM6883_006746 [Sporobolomyces salmoneus]|uniref:uncharacterized protein n=1 Tax=Sporobolomyces salmoneus TaxID=183962 RepID=UPI00317B3E8B
MRTKQLEGATTTRRPASLFSWKSSRSSIVVTSTAGSRKEEEDAKEFRKFKFPQTPSTPFASTPKHQYLRTSSSPSSVHPLVIEIESLPSLPEGTYKPLPSKTSERPSLPPSLPDFRHSTFQPLAFDTDSVMVPPPQTSFAKRLASKGPFPNRPLSTLSSTSSGPVHSSSSSHSPSPDKASTPPRSTSSPRLEPRSPRTRTPRRSRSTPNLFSASSSSPQPAPPTPPPLPITHLSPSPSSSSMHRSPSFTLSLPTVAEVPPSPPPPVPRRVLRPIVIAPRTPSTPSTPSSNQSQFSSANSSPRSLGTFELKQEAKIVEEKESREEETKERIDWADLERRLRNLSEDRLQVLLAELRC